MSDQDDDFKNPEEIQAGLNRAKINSFISNIGWQFIILGIVVYSTYLNNWLAGMILTGYGVLLALSCTIFFLVIIKPLEKLAVSSAMSSKMMLLDTPTAIVTRAIGTIFSIIEISLLISFDYPAMAGLWAATEVFQYIAAFKLKLASELGLEASSKVDAKYRKDPAWGKDLDEDLAQYQEDMKNLDKLITDLRSDDAIEYKKALDALIDERVKLVDAIDARITRAALETMKDTEDK